MIRSELLALSTIVPRPCQAPLEKSTMLLLAVSRAGVPLPLNAPRFARLPVICKVPPPSIYVPLLPMESEETLLEPAD